jgi:hypothetical protein
MRGIGWFDFNIRGDSNGNRRHRWNCAGPYRFGPQLLPWWRPEGNILDLNERRIVDRDAITIVPKRDPERIELGNHRVACRARSLVAARKDRQSGCGFRSE